MLLRQKFIVILCFCSSFAFSQSVKTRGWLGYSLSYKLFSDAKIQLKFQDRYDFLFDNNKFFVQPRFSYNLNKRISSSLAYRATFGGSVINHRLDLRLQYKKKIIKRTWLAAGFKWQYETIDKEKNWGYLYRPWVEVSRRIKKSDIVPYISYEGFYSSTYKGNEWEGSRLFVGSDFKINKHQDWGIKLGYRKKTIHSSSLDQLIFAISFSQEL